MKRILEVIFDGMDSKYGFDDEDTGLLVIVKQPFAGTLRVMVTDIDEYSKNAVLAEWDETWRDIGEKVKQEIERA